MTPQPFRVLQTFLKPGTSKALPVAILVTLLFFGTLFYVYVSNNYSYLVERNFRLLATWSTELSETVKNYERSFRFRVQEQESAGLVGPTSGIRSRGAHQTLTDEGLVLEGFASSDQSQPQNTAQDTVNYKLMLKQQTREQLRLLPFVQNVKPPEPSSESHAEGTQPNNQPPTVTFTYAPTQADGLIQAQAQEQDGTVTATASIVLGDLLKHVATEKIYDDVLLADPSGAIVYQRNASTLKFLHLGNLFHHQRSNDGWLSELFAKGGVSQDQAFDLKNISQVMKTTMPLHFQATVGGNTYEVFMQAVAFPSITLMPQGQDLSPNTPWIICGILPSSTFQEQYLAIPFTVLLFCLFVFISAFLALPIFSLLMMNPRERLTRFSVGSLLIANLLGAGVGTLFFLDLGFYRQSVDDFHVRLTATTDSMAEGFHAQLDRMVWQLDRYNQQFHELNDRARFPTEPGSKAWLARVNLPDPCKDSQDKALPFCYPNFSVAFWVDTEGILRETWTQAATPYVRGTHDLRQRDYVTKVQASHKNLHRRLINNRWLEFYVQPLISLESSTRSLVVSLPHQVVSDTHPHALPWVAAIQSEDFSLLADPVLPPGTGYAVIEDQTGLALFHSNGRRMLRENFLEETDNNPELAALIHARAEGAIEGDYWGVGHRFAIKPLSGLPWTLVVFESKEAFRTTNFEVLLFSLSLFTVYILALLLWIKGLNLIYRVDECGQRIRWTWPKQWLSRTYVWLSLLLLFLFLLGVTAIVGMDWQDEMGLPFRLMLAGLPFLAMWMVVRVLWKGHVIPRAGDAGQPSDPWALLHTSQLIGNFSKFAFTTFLVLGVFPAVVFFKIAHDQEMRLFAQHHLWGFAQTLVQQTHGPWLTKASGETVQDLQWHTTPQTCLITGCPINGESTPMLKSLACSPQGHGEAMPELHQTLHSIFSSVPLSTCLSFDSKSWNPEEVISTSGFNRFHQLIRKSSLQNPMNKESWGFLHTPSSDATAQWTQHISQGKQRIALRLQDFPQGTEATPAFGPLFLSLWLPLFPWNLLARLPAILLISALLMGIGYMLLRYMIRKIYAFPSFFLRSHERGVVPHSPTVLSLRHLLVLGPAGSGKSQLAYTLRADCQILDIQTSYGNAHWVENLITSLPEQATAVLLDHFEYQWEDLSHRKEKGILLERLLARDLKVCILSSKDPLEWTRSQWLSQSEQSSDASQAYWIDLLGSFGFIHFTPSRMEALLQEWLHPQPELPGSGGP
ncbi:MAG: cache domain-containing protein, partial [Nitrospirota bacterium]|nr:cache domain-containing protein [Nitrospirota bacterium]